MWNMLCRRMLVPHILIVAFLPLLCEGIPTILHLEKADSISGSTNSSHLVQRDRARHERLLHSSGGVINYTIGGTDDLLVGLYYTRIELGTPPRSFYVQVDTGSDLTWVGCMPCTSCPPMITGIPNISLHLYNPSTSSTFSTLSCTEKRCPTKGSNCSTEDTHCRYWADYADRSHIYGFYAQDLLTYNRNVGNSRTLRSATPFIFGCTTVESGFSTTSKTDGILGLGQQRVSLISQLADQGLSPKVFSHCLSGDKAGGGVLILGKITESDIIYSPLIPSQPHYNLDLQKISVNGNTLPIDPLMLSSLGERGVIIDSGTTFMYLEIGVLTQLINAINASTSARQMQSLIYHPCYLVSSSVAEVFPQISLHFLGGAELVLDPHDYLRYEGLVDGAHMWCTSFEASLIEGRPIILGDMVMKNRLFVYDLDGQRIGWKKYNCSAASRIINPKHVRPSAARSLSLTPVDPLVFWCLLILYLHQIPRL